LYEFENRRLEDILENVGNQIVDDSHWLPVLYFFILWKSMARRI